MTPAVDQRYSITDYRRLEEVADERHEYRDGVIVAVSGGTLEHSAIAGNIYALLRNALRRTQFKPYNSDLRVWLPQHNWGVYPDVMVIEGVAEFNDDRRDEITNPRLIVEVLSRSTEAYDRGDKFKYYRSLASFCEYVLVDQYQPYVECYTQTDEGDWLLRSHEGLEAQITLKTLNTQLALADIYEDIAWVANAE